jgi:hypothetical protein
MYDMQVASIDPLPFDDDNDDHSWSNVIFDDDSLYCIDSNIKSNTHNDEPPLEPTPIGSKNIEVVERVPLAAASWLKDANWSSFLTLLQDSNTTHQVPLTVSSTVTIDEDSCSVTSSKNNCSDETNFKASQMVQWNARFEDLVAFRNKYGHCLVPLTWPENPGLAHWIKRQRYQYSLKQEGKHSTLSPEREEFLDNLGFIWDSHAAQWEERLKELDEFRETHGHCYVPTKYPASPKLSIWVKCQRRQYKLFQQGSRSNMTTDRITRLAKIGFVFHPRVAKRSFSISSTNTSGSSSSSTGSSRGYGGGMEFTCL